jgi:hypothetical protein
LQNGAVTPGPQDSLSSPATPYQMIPAFYDTNGALRIGSAGQQAGLAIENPPKKTHLKNPLKMGFLGFFKFFLFFKKEYKHISLKQIFSEQIRQKLSFIYQKIGRYALN